MDRDARNKGRGGGRRASKGLHCNLRGNDRIRPSALWAQARAKGGTGRPPPCGRLGSSKRRMAGARAAGTGKQWHGHDGTASVARPSTELDIGESLGEGPQHRRACVRPGGRKAEPPRSRGPRRGKGGPPGSRDSARGWPFQAGSRIEGKGRVRPVSSAAFAVVPMPGPSLREWRARRPSKSPGSVAVLGVEPPKPRAPIGGRRRVGSRARLQSWSNGGLRAWW